MTTYLGNTRVADLGAMNIGAGAATVVFAPGEAVNIKRVIFRATAVQATLADTITMGKRDADDGNSATHSTFTYPTGGAIDTVYYAELEKPSDTDGTAVAGAPGIGGQTTFDATPVALEVLPGEEFWVTSAGTGDTGTANVYVEYYSKGFSPQYLSANAPGGATALARG